MEIDCGIKKDINCFTMKKFVFLLLTTFLVGNIFGQGSISKVRSALRGTRASVTSVDYSYYPTVNQSSLRLNWLGKRWRPYERERDGEGGLNNLDTERGMVVRNDYDKEVNFFAITWMFPNTIFKTISNSFQSSWGCLGISLINGQYRFGKQQRIRPFVSAELVGVSTLNESLGEKVDFKGKSPVFIYNEVSAGFDCYIGRHTLLKLSGGMMLRGINTLYPFASISFAFEENIVDKYRTKYTKKY